MKRRLGLNPLTIKQAPGLDTKVDIAARAGFDSVGLRGNEIADYLARGHGMNELKALIEKRGMTISDVGSVAGWQLTGHPPLVCRIKMNGEESHDELRKEAETFFRNAAAVGCDLVTAVSAIEEEGELAQAVWDFHELCRSAAHHGLRIALEFVGFGRQINNLAVAYKIISEADMENGGLLFDTFHFYRSRGRLEELEKVDAARIFLVHLNDVRDKPIDTIVDPDRLYPGLGVVDLAGIVRTLDRIGYRGMYSLEIFNADYWSQDALIVARTAKQYADRLFEELE
jgi:sugar phosphate isomerase/epimerase